MPPTNPASRCRVTAAIVLYKNDPTQVRLAIRSFLSAPLDVAITVIDNSPDDTLRSLAESEGAEYLLTGKNIGFGGGHNLALKQLAGVDAPYHLILNPDIVFDGDALARLATVMDSHPDVGLVMPKVLYPDGSHQYLCKLLPAPTDLILRRFLPGTLKGFASKRTSLYELRFLDSDAPAYVPSLSGCFMFARRSVLEAVGGFDERFFLYMEDVDLCRRMLGVSKLLYWPGVTVEHVHQMGSYRNWKLLLMHVRSGIQYFNKWGWIRDRTRTQVNRTTLACRGQMPPL